MTISDVGARNGRTYSMVTFVASPIGVGHQRWTLYVDQCSSRATTLTSHIRSVRESRIAHSKSVLDAFTAVKLRAVYRKYFAIG
jgi:hypothetical protein